MFHWFQRWDADGSSELILDNTLVCQLCHMLYLAREANVRARYMLL